MRLLARLLCVVSLPVVVQSHADAAPSPACPAEMSTRIPPRSLGAMSGSAFAQYVSSLSTSDRERAIEEQLLNGNIPRFLRRLKPVTLGREQAAASDSAESAVATICVMPDYLAIGSDEDYLRIPANLHTARAVATAFGFVLPTTTMVDAIYEQATYHLQPRPLPAGPQMASTTYYVNHNDLVQRALPSNYAGELVAGDKKDVVLTNRLLSKPGQIAIYGWHRPDAKPIQPLSTVHGVGYADYSHGIRLVSATVLLNGETRSMHEVLAAPAFAPILSREGPIDANRVLMAAERRLSAMAD